MRPVSIVGTAQLPVQATTQLDLRQLGAQVVRGAMQEAGVERVDALFASNMLGDELQGQKHVAALIADESGLEGIEALQVQAAMASGSAALRMAYLAVGSGEADLAVVVGVEKMSEGLAAPALSKALDAKEVADGATLISKNADLMRLYRKRYNVPEDGFVNFPVVAHHNARNNPNALFKDMNVNPRTVMKSRMIHDPLRLLDCSPICDGAAAAVLSPAEEARAHSPHPVRILSSTVATDRFRVGDRPNPLWLEAAHKSALKAYRLANVHRGDIDFFEVHDAFSIMACMQLEAAGFADQGQGWHLAEEKRISLRGDIPISTMGGLKARGHPIGATALYQVSEMVLQLRGRAGKNRVREAKIGMMSSVGGAGSTVITHILGI
ncbi:MAG: beta-ketoacyl synthase N-terminal-like domain-containing protein [Anaerolineales bacterium]|nr:beta-ketoacyl synthase N-terminal-like domain-containing protein [Anaerolineales bacterium]